MSDVADIERTARQRWASPGGRHDRLVRFLRVALPASIGVLTVALIAAPLTMTGEISFVLAKDSVDMARERLRIQAATYRGEDSKGQPFILRAGSAVQKSSKDPIVKITDLDGQITLADGPATIAAHQGRYDMDKESVSIDGPLSFKTADGYAIDANDVQVDLKTKTMASGGAVTGRMPLGTFSGSRMKADLNARTVSLEGRAHLHIVQGVGR
jgi:lipopolysaccharide export system protein LptC